MKRSFILLTLCASLLVTGALAQEICNNGIDDDNDGLIDCFDADCVGNNNCDGFYIGNDGCSAVPPAFPLFSMTQDFASPNETTNHIGRMAIGDMNGDGMPEIVTLERYTKKLFILNGNNGTVRTSTIVTFDPIWEIAIGNIDNGNGSCAEVYFAGIEGTTSYFYAYDCNLNQLWKAKIRDRDTNDGNALDPINYGLADFDGDGKVELYAKDMIFDAHTGTKIIETATTDDASWNNINGGPVAVDMDVPNNGKLELVLGLKVYDVNLGSRAANAGTLTARAITPPTPYYVRYPFNATSVADYNLDGYLDVIASGSDKSGSNKRTTVFFWDVKNNVVKTFIDDNTSDYYPDGWKNGTGRINIADLDGDGKMNVSYVSGKYLYALDENFNKKWRITINEETSGYTGCTLFDFVGDGSSEIVYRDERYLYIIDGSDGSIHSQQNCVSRTQREYPIVADVDADGSTEICVVCGFNDQDAIDNFTNLNYSQYSQVRVFKSASEPWVPARRLWNQHGYFNVNVNNDLTIPRRQQNHNAVFSDVDCFDPSITRDIRPLNSFLNQSPFLDSKGCPVYAAADIAFKGGVTIKPPTCPDVDYKVSFTITNLGSLTLSRNVPVTFYTKNPLKPGAVKLNTIQVPVSALGYNDVAVVTDAVVTGNGADSLYVVLNDAGTTMPSPIKFPNSGIVECVYDNIAKAKVVYLPAPIVATPTDFIRCDPAAPAKGSATAYVPTSGGGQDITNYTFLWSNGSSVVTPANFTGTTYSGLSGGQYTVTAKHKTLNCGTVSATVTVVETQINYKATVTKVHEHDNCVVPNGELSVTVTDNNTGVIQNPANFDFTWTIGIGGTQVSNTSTATNLVGSPNPGTSYVVIAKSKINGCQAVGNETLFDLRVKPVVSASAPPISCSASATSTATADVNSVTTGFTFKWFKGTAVKPTEDASGPSYANLIAGKYTVNATDNTTQCISNPVTITVTQTLPPTITASSDADMSSCDPTQPNGSVTANVSGGTAGYNFKWFKGQNTLPANLISSVNTATGLKAGIYTVEVEDATTHCKDTKEVTVVTNITMPGLAFGTKGDLTNCTTANGSVQVIASPGAQTDYVFSWYKGTASAVDGTPDYPDTDNQLDGLGVGDYTAVAVNSKTHCTTGTVTTSIIDATPAIAIIQNVSAQKFPTDCNTNDGKMEVQVSAAGNVNGFKVEWFLGNIPIQTDIGVTVSTADGLKSGNYRVKATNLDNGCSKTEIFALPFADAQILTFVAQDDIIKCSPQNEGTITVNLKPTPLNTPITFSVDDYILRFYNGTDDTGPQIGGDRNGNTGTYGTGPAPGGNDIAVGTANYQYTGLTPGTYTVYAIENNPFLSNCPSLPVTVTIEDKSVNPIVQGPGTIPINTYCGGGVDGNATITVTVDSGAPAAGYTFNWFEGKNTTPGSPTLGTSTTGSSPAPGNEAQNVPGGFYSVLVTNNFTQCKNSGTYSVIDNPPVVAVTAPGLALMDVDVCRPAHAANGSATINKIVVDGVDETNLAGYTFAWRDATQAPAGAGTSITGLNPGIYYVSATNTLNCTSSQVQFEIKDLALNSVTVTLASFVEPTQCAETDVDGSLEVTPSGTLPGAYTVTWLDGANNPLGAQPVPDTKLQNITITVGTTITYGVLVTNTTTGCTITDAYTLNLYKSPVVVSASATPMTYCTNPFDGKLFALVAFPQNSAGKYTYTWTSVNTGVPFPDTDGTVDDVAAGDYTVTAVETADPGCVSQQILVTVTEDRSYPTVTAEAVMPLSNCDMTRPNGIATAAVEGGIPTDYIFDWYEGLDVTDPTKLKAANSVQVDGLAATVYTVHAIDRVTGCDGTASIAIPDGTAPLPPSDIQVVKLQDVSTCLPVDPDGALSASVNGDVVDYDFYWYNTNPGADPDITSADFTGREFYDSLAAGTYYVSVVNRTTGCPGGPASAVIEAHPVFPDFDFLAKTATCKKDDTEPGDGYISLVMNNSVDIGKVEWFEKGSNASLEEGPNLGNADAGTYTVRVTTKQGCYTDKDVLLKTDIRPFNGISRNHDGQNETFFIKCLEEFPDNIVKIFNRAGTLVYEAEHYDNIDIYFDGISNKGISLMGNNLPDGTYFYVIDKRDGSKPVAGYLEIVN